MPRYWVADAGTEYTGKWFEQFCDYAGATRIQPPPGAPRKNSLAENALGRINAEVSHRLLGSTDPDKAGRSVTAKQKSYATACHDYRTIVAELENYLFEDLPKTPLGKSRTSPSDEWARRAESIGTPGVIRVSNMDDFLIATSVPLTRSVKVDPVRGIRYLQRKYVSSELLHSCRTESPMEFRIDCVDQHRMYVKFRSGWVLAQTSDGLKRGPLSTVDKLFDAAADGAYRSAATKQRDAIRLNRTLRNEAANRAAQATKHLEPQLDSTSGEEAKQVARVSESERICWTEPGISLLPFELEGEP